MLQFILVVMGKRTLSDYLAHRNTVKTIERQGKDTALQIKESQRDQQRVIEAGFNAIEGRVSHEVGSLTHTVELSLDKIANGINTFNADFNLLMGAVIWKLQMQQETLTNLLHEIRKPEFEKAAEAKRKSGEDSYRNGWYEYALNDFLEAEQLIYKDFSVLRSIAHIYFDELQDLSKALEYFRKAAMFSRPLDVHFSAECHYYAGMMLAAQQQHKESLDELRNAVKLNPNFYDAHYWCACLASLINDEEAALDSLETAIKGDPRYRARAESDPAFDNVRPAVQSFLDQLLKESEEKVSNNINDLQLAINTVEKISGRPLKLSYTNAKNELLEKANQVDYEINLTLIPDIQNLRDEIIQRVEEFFEKQIEEKKEQIKDQKYQIERTIQPIKQLEKHKAAITKNYREWNSKPGGCVHFLLGCGVIIFVSPIIAGLIGGFLSIATDINEGMQNIFIFIGIILGIICALACYIFFPLWIWDAFKEYSYKRSVIKPIQNIEKEISNEKRRIKKFKEKLDEGLAVLKRQHEDLEKKVKTVLQLR